MTDRPIQNVAASVRQRLTNVARASNRPFQEVLQYFAMERFLYRLTKSPHADRFVLKGALMFNAWRAPTSRPTKDIDLLGHMENSVESLAAVMQEICRQSVDDDGLVFDAASVQGFLIKEDADYEGVRVTFRANLENSRIPMQIDIGFGDVMFPGPEDTDYPAILDYPAPRLRGYRRETAVAEKFEAMAKLGLLNSRMKDYYDIWQLSRQFDFDGAKLSTAIERTFAHRRTQVVAQPTALTQDFSRDGAKIDLWKAFVRKSRLSDAPNELVIVADAIAEFLGPPASAAIDGRSFTDSWIAPGPWRS